MSLTIHNKPTALQWEWELRGKRQELRSKVRGKRETSQVVLQVFTIYDERFTIFMAHTNSAVRGEELRSKVRSKGRIKEKDEANLKCEFENFSLNASDYTTSD